MDDKKREPVIVGSGYGADVMGAGYGADVAAGLGYSFDTPEAVVAGTGGLEDDIVWYAEQT
jgi:hypothetical protein